MTAARKSDIALSLEVENESWAAELDAAGIVDPAERDRIRHDFADPRRRAFVQRVFRRANREYLRRRQPYDTVHGVSLWAVCERHRLFEEAGPKLIDVDCGDGWAALLDDLLSDLRAMRWRPSQLVQLKEKFGTLRIYLTVRDARVLQRVDAAELQSARVCEECGRDGRLRGEKGRRGPKRLWTLCDQCAREKGYL